MASSSGILGICNAALAELGGGDVEGGLLDTSSADLSSPSTDLENHVASRIDEVLMDVLSSYGWKHISTREKLTASGTVPIVEFDYAYAYPADSSWLALRLNRVWLDEWECPRNPELNLYNVEGGYLLTDATTVHVSFVRYPNLSHATANNSTWNSYVTAIQQNPKLYRACVLSLAWAMSFYITGGSAHRERLRMESEEKRGEAVGWEARNGKGIWYGTKELIAARYR